MAGFKVDYRVKMRVFAGGNLAHPMMVSRDRGKRTIWQEIPDYAVTIRRIGAVKISSVAISVKRFKPHKPALQNLVPRPRRLAPVLHNFATVIVIHHTHTH